MSVKQMALVWEHEFPHNKQSVLLALTDHANDRGEKMFPSIARISWKTGYSTRQVKRILQELLEDEVILLVRKAAPYRPIEYKMNWKKATKKSPFIPKRKGDNLSPLKNQQEVTSNKIKEDISTSKGDSAMSPEPSLEPSIKKEKIKELPFKINPDLNDKLDKAKTHFKEIMLLNGYNEMIAPLIVKSLNEDTLTLVCQNEYHQNWIGERIISMKGYLTIFRTHFENYDLKIKLVLLEEL